MRKRMPSLVLATLLCLMIVACSQPAPAAPAASTPAAPSAPAAPAAPEVKKGEFALKIASQQNSTHPSTLAINDHFKVEMEKATSGRVEVQVFDNSQLGGERDMMEQMQTGTLSMAYISPVTAALDPTINILDLPFLFRDYDHVDKVIAGPIGLKILEPLLTKGLRGLGYFDNGFRVLSNSKRPINSADDLKGLKIRVPEAPISIAIFEALGTNPTPMAYNELYGALQQKVVDGQENGYNNFTPPKFYEVQKYVAETNHMWGSCAFYVSEKYFQTLPPEIQQELLRISPETCAYQRKIYREVVSKNKQIAVDAGVEVTTPDLAPFKEKTKVVYDDFLKKYPQYADLLKQIQAL